MIKPRLKSVILFLMLFPVLLAAQDPVGLPFLKIGSGARQSGMGGVFCGVGDDIQTLTWNPGGLGHLRRWQWSATYNRWFTDVYQAGFSYAGQFRAAKSRKSSIGFYLHHMGMPDWDATGGRRESVSAGHLVGGLTVAQRFDYLHPAIAVGMTIKGIHSRLGTYSASGMAMDWGILIKPSRIRLGALGFGVFDYGLFAFGASVSHLGLRMTFDREETALPQTWRVGASYFMGRYNGWSLLLASEVVGVKHRDLIYALGGEVWWRDLLGARCGYPFNGDDLEGFSFGFGFRWNDVFRSAMALPTRFADAFELNFGDAGYGEVLQQTYRGSVSHYSIAPEPFYIEEAEEVQPWIDSGSMTILPQGSMVRLTWEESIDPDPFDEVNYLLIIDKSEARVKRAIRELERDMPRFLKSALYDSLGLVEGQPGTEYTFVPTEGGTYYWAVAAHDLAFNARLAKKGNQPFAEFMVAVPDLSVREIAFEPGRWITTTPEQGVLSVRIGNGGTAATDTFRLLIREGRDPVDPEPRVLLDAHIPYLRQGTDTLIVLGWNTTARGWRFITAVVDPDSAIVEFDETNNTLTRRFMTIPKGRIEASDSVQVMATGYDSTEISIVPEIYFDAHSPEIKSEFIGSRFGIPGVLSVLGQRLRQHPEVTLRVLGSVDMMSQETDPSLADARARAVRDTLIRMGVSPSQLVVISDHPNQILGTVKRPRPPQDDAWVSQENRVVSFSADRAHEEKLFSPIPVAVDTTLRDSVRFALQVVSPGGVASWELGGKEKSVYMVDAVPFRKDSLWRELYWYGTDREKVIVPRDRWYAFQLILSDTLGRTFYTRPDSIFLQEKSTIRRKEVFGAAKFARTEPVFQFYWDRLMRLAEDLIDNPHMHIRFEGHACAIGPEDVNLRLSKRRADYFTNGFLDRLRKTYPSHYEDIRRRIETPTGYGEQDPLRIRFRDVGEVLLGDNQSPVGRYRNRRISVMLYREN